MRLERDKLRVSGFAPGSRDAAVPNWAKVTGRGDDAGASTHDALNGILDPGPPTQLNDTIVSDGAGLVPATQVESESGAGLLDAVGCDLSGADAVIEACENGVSGEGEKGGNDTNEPVFSEHLILSEHNEKVEVAAKSEVKSRLDKGANEEVVSVRPGIAELGKRGGRPEDVQCTVVERHACSGALTPALSRGRGSGASGLELRSS
jgi:hypothetical protein